MNPPASAAGEDRGASVLRYLDPVCDAVVGAAIAGELIVVLANVLSRSLFHVALLWTNEVGALALAVIAFIGGALAYRRGAHMSVQALVASFPPHLRTVCAVLVEYAVLGLAIVVLFASFPYLQVRWLQTSPMLGMPAAFLTLPLSVGMVLLIAFALERLMKMDGRFVMSTGTALVLFLAAVLSSHDLWHPFVTSNGALGAGLTALLAAVFLGLPIGFALLLCAWLYVALTGSTPMIVLPQSLGDGVGGNILLAVPFFILAGLVMDEGGISLRLIAFVRTLVGHFRGGLLHVSLASMYVVSGLSGSKTADVAAVGIVMRDLLAADGYAPEEGAAVLAASAAMGETIPPSIAMLILGSITSLSMGALFVGGLLPAVVVGLCLMAVIALRAGRAAYVPVPRAAWTAVRAAGIRAVLPLLMPVLLFAGILSGLATPSEVSAISVAYGVLLAVLVYRSIGGGSILRMIVHAGTVAGMILFIVAAASSISWTLSAANVSQHVLALLRQAGASAPIFMLISIVVLIVLGSLLEGFPALIILAPLMLPLAQQLGINPLHYGIVLLIAMGTGSFAPPLGVGFYVACAVMRANLGKTARVMLAYSGTLVLSLLILAFVPWITLVVPAAFGLTK